MMLVRLANGFRESIERGKWSPSGTPAIARLIERLDRGPEALSLMLTRGLAPDAGQNLRNLRARQKRIEGLQTPVTVLAEGPHRYSGIGFWLREAVHLLHAWVRALRFKPDIIYIDRSNILAGAVLARFGPAPVVLRLMGVPPELRKILSGEQFARRIFRWAYRSPFAQVVSTLDGSRAVDFMEQALGARVERSVMLNGVDSKLLAGEPPDVLRSIPEDRVVVTFLGRVEALKGAKLFVDALLALPGANEGLIHGLIVGEGGLTNELKAKVDKAGASNRITFAGSLRHDEVNQAHGRSDIYVSLNRQGHLSNATLEAMAHNVPVVIQDLAPPDDGMDEFESLVPRQAFRVISSAASAGELAALLVELAKNKTERAKMAEALEKFAGQNLVSWDQRIEREVALLSRAAGREVA